MTSRKSWFGPSKAAIWQQLCEEIDADFIPGGRWSKDKVKVRAYHREWVFTLDTYTVSNGKTSATYIRMRAPYVNWDDFQFRMYTATQFRRLLVQVPSLELCDVYDFWYEIEQPLRLDDEITDTVFILRRKG